MRSHDIVFLVPGFLGFERSGNFSNFADRVCSALRTHLEGHLARPVDVLPLPSLPTTSFAERQQALLVAIARQLKGRDEVQRIHLLGHSVGGIDAYLLSCHAPVGGGDFARRDPDRVRDKLRTVISLGTPHHGTCLAEAPGAGHRNLKGLLGDRAGAMATVQLINKLVTSALHDVGPRERTQGILREGRKVSHFMAELLRWQGFLHALTPSSMEALYEQTSPLPTVTRRSFVTFAGQRPDTAELPSGFKPVDEFFSELASRTAGPANGFTRHSSAVRAAITRLRDALESAPLIVSSVGRAPSHVDGQTNDGMVNSARQLIDPADVNELAGLVVADHFDVLGYYDRSLSAPRELGREHELLSGLLHSGSFFRDAEFFALYRSIGDAICQQCVEPSVEADVPLEAPKRKPAKRSPSRRPSA